MAVADWCIGSSESVPTQTIRVTHGATTEDLTLTAGSYYLDNPGGTSLSLVDALSTTLNTHSLISDANARLMQNRRVRITASVTFNIVFLDANVLQNMIGATGALATSDDHQLANVSNWLWSPGRCGRSRARAGTDGTYVYDTMVGQAGPGNVVATRHNRWRENEFTWRYVNNNRMWTTTEAGGEWFTFYDEVLSKFLRFKVYRQVTEDDASTSDVSLPSSLPSSGAYILRSRRTPIKTPFGREFGFIERVHPVTLPTVQSPEYS